MKGKSNLHTTGGSSKLVYMYIKTGYAIGKKHGMWRGGKAKYQALHNWIRKSYGKATKCENSQCLGKSKQYQWALRQSRKYSRKVRDYIQLCRSCHRKMDITVETRKKISNSLIKHGCCQVKGCKHPHCARGYCSHHYNTLYRKIK